jgi:glutaminyl-peptide cyclotransferase
VTDGDGSPIGNLNEVEFVKGEIFANIWQTDVIARIDPASGKVVGWIDLRGLLSEKDRQGRTVDVLNGIAYDSKRDRLFVTGKLWPKLYEIRLVERAAQPAALSK